MSRLLRVCYTAVDSGSDLGKPYVAVSLLTWIAAMLPPGFLDHVPHFDAAGIDIGYRGERLGLPPEGVGSVAGYGRRFGALFIDWIASALVAHLLFPQFSYGTQQSGVATLIVFFIMKSALTMLRGASFGQRILGIRVIALGKPYVNPWRALLRTLLICP